MSSDPPAPGATVRRRRVTRSYTLALVPNRGKAEEARYAIWWQTRWTADYVRELYEQPANATVSTRGKGRVNNRALKRARDMLRAGRALTSATGVRFRRPATAPRLTDGMIRAANGTSFHYWAKVTAGPWIPAVPHRAFTKAMRAGGVLRETCEIRLGRRGGLVAIVTVELPRMAPVWSRDCLGIDVGVNAGVARSDGYIGASLEPILRRSLAKRAEQRRQRHIRSSARTAVKQALDREARRAVTLAARTGRSLVVERPKTLANLKPSGFIGGWARRHFGERVRQIAEVSGVAVVAVNPAYTSQACRQCNHVHRDNRRGVQFECRSCGARDHADVNAAHNLVRRARGVRFWPDKKAAIQTRSVAAGGAS